ncbi:pyrroline-5-carboxylate reductase [Chryseomicrobium sp. FSL W7-1435]|uniref:pyrroline-5-carboxylate reductase n=1 Tax=Chryseomicrobium sp. FSL W7-1435 TaxID=2921704 RepID=UPI00315B2ABB
MKIVFFGAGAMAEAIISGWVNSPKLPPLSLYVTNKSDEEALVALQSRYQVSLVKDHPECIQDANYVVLAMKPKDAKEAFKAIQPLLPSDVTVLSVLAGIDLELLQHAFPGHPIVRVMPNTSAMIGKSATVLSHTSDVTDQNLRFVTSLFEAIGSVEVMLDEHMHAVTALSGSGPAYVYYITEALQRAAHEIGLPKEQANALILQTLEGAVAMLKKTKEEPATLRKHVTSPGGTTEAGLKQMEELGLQTAIIKGLQAACTQSNHLGDVVKDSMLPSRSNL